MTPNLDPKNNSLVQCLHGNAMQVTKIFVLIGVLAWIVVPKFAHAQSVLQMNCQALVFVQQDNVDIKKRIEDFEFLINRKAIGFNFLIRGDTHLKLAIRDRSHTDLVNRKITQKVNLEDREWIFEFAEGVGMMRDLIKVKMDSLSGKFSYERNYRGLMVQGDGICKRSIQANI